MVNYLRLQDKKCHKGPRDAIQIKRMPAARVKARQSS